MGSTVRIFPKMGSTVRIFPKMGCKSKIFQELETRFERLIRRDTLDSQQREPRTLDSQQIKPRMGSTVIIFPKMGCQSKVLQEMGCQSKVLQELETRLKRLIRCDTLDSQQREPRTLDSQQIKPRTGRTATIFPKGIHDVASDEKMIVDNQEVYSNYRRSRHGTKLMKSILSLAPSFLPCAGGTGHGSGPPEHQGHSDIYQSTLDIVSSCPSPREYMQKSLAKCADVCGSYMQDGNCAYHCMRDSSKTKLVEFCAKPKILFEYCPEYDPVDQTIQKDLATLCNSTFSRNYYNSSDIYFCDPDNCLQLHESSVRSGATTLTTLMNETTEMNGGDNQEWFLPLLVVLAALILPIIIGWILRVFVKRGISSARTRKMTKKRNQNEKQYVYIEKD